MNKVLSRRILRGFRENIGRYIALTLLIIMGLYLVVSIVGASETILTGTENQKSKNMVEDGEFTVFLSLTEKELETLTENGTVIEEMFSIDIESENNSKLRLFKNREKIDLIQLDTGRLAERNNEAVLEKGYAQAHNLTVGDNIKAGGVNFKLVGIGSVPDYDQVLSSFSDTAAERNSFGLIFTTSEQYDYIINKTSQKAEEYTYAYRLRNITDNELKEKIKNLDFDYTKIENKYFKETIDEALKDKTKFEDGIKNLYDGSIKLTDGIKKIDNYGDDLTLAADKLFETYLSQANASINAMGQKVLLTKNNYNKILKNLFEATKFNDIKELEESLDNLKAFSDSINEYAKGVNEAAKGSSELNEGISELKEETDNLLDEIFDIEVNNLTSFITADENIRIAAAAGDVVMNKVVGLAAGVIILVMFAYVISVFVVHQIEREQSVIGTLYALGVKKKSLLLHYIALPTMISFIGGIIGSAIGFSPFGIGLQTVDSYDYYSLPVFDTVYPLYLIIYAVVMPPLISAAVNALVVNKKLSKTALYLIRNEQNGSSYKQFSIKTKNFERAFLIRQMVRESRSALTVIFGMFISLIIMILSLNSYILCDSIKYDNVRDTKYEYMYMYKYPEKTVPKGGESAYVEGLSIECYDYILDVSIIGLNENSKYFDARPAKSKNKVIINNSIAQRYGFNIGDKFTLFSSSKDIDYSFTVDGIVKYNPGFTVFMDIESMRELFGRDEEYFNVVYSDKELDIEEGRLYSVTTKSDIEKSSSVFVQLMMSMVVTLLSVSVIILAVVIYLMMGVMIDRSEAGISLIKIFGYRPNEIRKLYLNGIFIVVAVGAAITIPLSKFVMDSIYPLFIANVVCSMNLEYPWYLYIGIYCLILLIYFVTNRMLIGKINKISPAEILKNRE